MSGYNIYTPEGVVDILFDECRIKRTLEAKTREIFNMRGYMEVETPSLEFMDVFWKDGGANAPETMFKFFDKSGKILVLRPDMTECIARVTATKMKDRPRPIKYSYVGNIFKFDESGGGKQREFTQAGIEIVGINSPEADAEVIVTAIESAIAAGLVEFQIDIGQVDFFKGIIEETGLSVFDAEEIRLLIDSKDFLGIEKIIKDCDIRDDLKKIILNLPGLFGSSEVIDKVEKITTNARSLAALENLRKVLELVNDYGYEKYVSIDLGVVQNLNYYTGITFRGFTYGIGFPFMSGGRYDNLIEQYGEKSPATGFAMGINMLMTALNRQKISVPVKGIDALICYDESARKKAFEVVRIMQNEGFNVEIDITKEAIDQIMIYSRNKSIKFIAHLKEDDKVDLYNLDEGIQAEADISKLSELLKAEKKTEDAK
jgi:ATP phosphoribosyltransferase regulatory subunit